jgi:hypothetical protein
MRACNRDQLSCSHNPAKTAASSRLNMKIGAQGINPTCSADRRRRIRILSPIDATPASPRKMNTPTAYVDGIHYS